jgi:hypothetical protein
MTDVSELPFIPKEKRVALRLMGLSTGLLVFRNGKRLVNGFDYIHMSGSSTVVFNDPCVAGDKVSFNFPPDEIGMRGEQHEATEGQTTFNLAEVST